MTAWGACVAVVTAGLTAGAAACSPSVSDHDNRIFVTPASAKLPAVDLASAYQSDADGADSRYRGRVLEVSGTVRGAASGTPVFLLAGHEGGPSVEVSLHEDVSAAVLKTVADGQRITMKCICEGLDQHVRLKSCVMPDTGR